MKSFARHTSTPPRDRRNDEVARLNSLTYAACGMVLTSERLDYILDALALRADALSHDCLSSYLGALESGVDPSENKRFLDSLLIHTTSFFRDSALFQWLGSDGFGAVIKQKPPTEKLVIWSAACSSGEEVYSALMTAAECAPLHYQANIDAIGTDLSDVVLKTAQCAVYTGEQIAGINLERRRKFILSSKSGKDLFKIVPDLRNHASWQQANLIEARSLPDIIADVIFLRNVLIYFDAETQRKVTRSVLDRLAPNGIVLTGPNESGPMREAGLKMIRPSVFGRKPE